MVDSSLLYIIVMEKHTITITISNSKSMVSYKKVRSDGLLVKNVHN